MRIGIRVPAKTSGGGDAFVRLLREALVTTPGCSSVTSFRMGGFPVDAARKEVVVHVPTDPIRRRLVGSRRLAEAVRDNAVDVMLMPGTEVNPVAGVPSVMWPLTVAPFETVARDQLGRTLWDKVRWQALGSAVTHAASRADAFVFSSHYARSLYESSINGVRSAPAVIIPPAPTLSLSDTVQPREVKRPYLLFVSHLYPYKMVVETVRAHASALQRGVDLDLAIAGAPVHADYRTAVSDEIARCGTTERVALLGSLGPDRLRGLYEHARAFVFPSVSENAGSYALLDAFRHGLPVFSSGLSSMPEACQDAARYFDPRDPSSLAAELVRAATLPGEWSRLAEASRRRGREVNTWSGIASSLIDFLGEVVGRSRARRPGRMP